MKKITLLVLATMGCFSFLNAQCINTLPYPTESVASDNSGDPQQINSCVYTGNYSTVSNLIVGKDYTFSLKSNGEPVAKYITVTDVDNNPLGYGLSPVSVPAVGETSVRVHYSEDASCGTLEWCLESYVAVTLSCPFPTDIQISGVTTTSANFAWNIGGSESAWEVRVQPKGDPAPTPDTSGTDVEGEPEYAVSDLEAGHRYQFYIRADCGSEFSPWRGPYDFNAGCDPISAFDEDFDGVSDELPTCWTALRIGSTPDSFIGLNSLSQSAPNAVQIANGNSAPDAGLFLVSPNLSTVGTGTHRLKFYTRGYGNVSVEVGTISSTTTDAVFNLIETVNATANYTEHIVDFTSYSGTDTFIAFRHANTNTYNPVFLDDIRWEPAPLCPDVQDIEMTALAQTTATVAWEPGGTETQWDVVYSDTATDPDGLTPIAPAPTDPQAELTGLQPDTTYQVWVRSSCGESLGNGAWMNPVTFTTACNPVTTLSENFETTDNDDLPPCWSAIVTGASTFNSSVGVVNGNAASGSKAVSLFDGDGAADAKIVLVSPSLSTVATGTHRVKFYARANGTATLEVGTLDSAASGGTFTESETIEVTSAYAEYVVDFSGYAGSDTHFGFRHTAGQYASIYLDNIRWELTPECADVTNLTATNPTENSILIDWTANAGESQWDVVFGTADVTDPNTLIPIDPAPTASQATLSGLTPNTAYNVWVRSVCGGTQGNGAWIGPLAFRTACVPANAFSEGFETAPVGALPDCWSAVLAGPTLGQYAAVRTVSNDAAFGSNAVEIHANSSAPTDWVMLVSPYLSNLGAGTHRLKFYALSYNAATPFEIGTMNGNTAQSTYTVFEPLTLGDGYNEYLIDFTTYSGSDTYIVLRNVAGNYNSVFIDNVRWEFSPACPDVTGIQASGIGTGSATVTWTPGGEEPNWQVAYGPVTVSDPATLTPSDLLDEPSYEITGLEDNTNFNIWVRSVCAAPDGNGAWIGPIVFRTKCLATAAPYTQDFESVNTPDLPECTTRAHAGAGNDWDTSWGDSAYGFDGKVLRYNGNGSEAQAWFYTQGVQLVGGTEYTISYKYGNNSSDNYVERLLVAYGTSPVAASMTEQVADHDQIDSGMATTNSFTFTPEATADYYFGFYAYSAANQSQLYVDNIAVAPSLSVPDAGRDGFVSYPNPVADVLNLSYDRVITEVSVFNMLGQKILGSRCNDASVRIDLSGLTTGSYLVKVSAGEVTKTIRILKK